MPFATAWMDLEGIMLSEISKTEKDKYYTLSFICGILKIKQRNEYNKTEEETITDRRYQQNVRRRTVDR